MRWLLLVLPAVLAAQQPPLTIREDKFEGRPAWVLENGLIRVSVLSGGGHIAETRLITGDPKAAINPMRVPHYPTIDPHTYDPAKHDAVYGEGPAKWLMSGYMGHLLCFPLYGAPSADEVKAGLASHGEAPISEWKKIRIEQTPSKLTLFYGSDLRKTQFRVERAVSIARGQRTIRVEEWVENLTDFDRPVNWMQHATFGPPFAEPGRTVMDHSGTRGQVSTGRSGSNSLEPGSGVNWPRGIAAGGTPVDLRVFQPREPGGTYYVVRLDPAREQQFFTMFNPGYHMLIGYVFSGADHPWLADWQENRNIAAAPWNRKVVARGIEFGSSPFDEGLRKSVERGTFMSTPAYRWIGARERRKTGFTIVLMEIHEGFAGAKDLRISPEGEPVLTAR